MVDNYTTQLAKSGYTIVQFCMIIVSGPVRYVASNKENLCSFHQNIELTTLENKMILRESVYILAQDYVANSSLQIWATYQKDEGTKGFCEMGAIARVVIAMFDCKVKS